MVSSSLNYNADMIAGDLCYELLTIFHLILVMWIAILTTEGIIWHPTEKNSVFLRPSYLYYLVDRCAGGAISSPILKKSNLHVFFSFLPIIAMKFDVIL